MADFGSSDNEPVLFYLFNKTECRMACFQLGNERAVQLLQILGLKDDAFIYFILGTILLRASDISLYP